MSIFFFFLLVAAIMWVCVASVVGRPVITWSVCWRLMEATHYRIDPQYYSLYHTRELERLNGSTLTRKPSRPCQTVIFLTITFYFTTKFFLKCHCSLKTKNINHLWPTKNNKLFLKPYFQSFKYTCTKLTLVMT